MADATQRKPASPTTIAVQSKARAALPPDNGRDEEFARRGFIATAKNPVIRNSDGAVVWDMSELDWVQGEPPPTVNPSLWRHARLLRQHGLFKVAERTWQVRGFDASNMTIVRGNTGWIVIDPLMTTETAGAALALVTEQLGQRPVSGVIYTHSHPDHFGGVRAVITPGAQPPIIAPDRLVEESVAENVLAGNAMNRRSAYQFGASLEPGPQGFVSGGIVGDAAKNGTVTLVPPTDYIKRTGETRVIDGVRIEFQMVPETEAPSEMNLFLPDARTLYISEIATCTMHNVQTPRGALVRDTNRWAGYITEMIELYGERTDALATGHCWPRFGNQEIKQYLALQRDNYKFIHDQTLRLLNTGQTPTEIAENLQRPPALANEWSNRGYYGTVRHNAKGVYQRYIGWWSGIPAEFDMYPQAEQGRRYVAAMGGADKVISLAQKAQEDGDYRWSAQLLNHVVFSDASNGSARSLLADAYEQLGYQAESAIWRNIYLVGAAELRGAKPNKITTSSPDM
ncbi:MAG: alkyl sulfatase dimerization domain-containing protein, partial [Steroidobacteraceae bacterium]